MNLTYTCICGTKIEVVGQRFDAIEADKVMFKQLLHDHLQKCGAARENELLRSRLPQ